MDTQLTSAIGIQLALAIVTTLAIIIQLWIAYRIWRPKSDVTVSITLRRDERNTNQFSFQVHNVSAAGIRVSVIELKEKNGKPIEVPWDKIVAASSEEPLEITQDLKRFGAGRGHSHTTDVSARAVFFIHGTRKVTAWRRFETEFSGGFAAGIINK